MQISPKSIRPFLGASNYAVSRRFYRAWGFAETVLSPQLSVFEAGDFAFYLQDADVSDWLANTMVFLEVADVAQFWQELARLNLPATYETVKLVPPTAHAWGRECFVHDPSGVLWHVGEFF